jgi:vacuolar iron transporter family protein
MAAGELVSVRAQDEPKEQVIEIEAAELRDEPEAELRELAAMDRSGGVPAEDAMTVARILSSNHKLTLGTRRRTQLRPNRVGSLPDKPCQEIPVKPTPLLCP